MRLDIDVHTHANLGYISDQAKDFGIFCVSEQALQDCNFYCKQDTGALIQSAVIHSDVHQGVLKWTMPYAEFQYNFPNTRHEKNPNAVYQWCAKAYDVHHDEWLNTFIQGVRRGGLR